VLQTTDDRQHIMILAELCNTIARNDATTRSAGTEK